MALSVRLAVLAAAGGVSGLVGALVVMVLAASALLAVILVATLVWLSDLWAVSLPLMAIYISMKGDTFSLVE